MSDSWSHYWECEAYPAGAGAAPGCFFGLDPCINLAMCHDRLARRRAAAAAFPAAVAELERLFNPRTGVHPVAALVDEHHGAVADADADEANEANETGDECPPT